MKWFKVFDGSYHLKDSKNSRFSHAIIEKQPYGRQLWSVEVTGRGRVRDGNHDLFSFNLAKQIAIREVNNEDKLCR